VTAAETLRVAAVLDLGRASAERHSRALGGFVAEGLTLADGTCLDAVTLVLGTDDPADERLLAAPTERVRLIRLPVHRADAAAAALATLHEADGGDLYVFPSGPAGAEAAARLAARTGGSVLTGVLSADFSAARLVCRRTVYSGHLTGEFALGRRPWCLVLDASRDDAHTPPPLGHTVEVTTLSTADKAATESSLLELELLEKPPTGDLETARFLVVAGRGAGSRSGVERIAAAAARMGAVFGVTRPVVMNAWAGPDRQVGVSGTRAAPAVCIVAGVSGAPAFVWGVERAGFIAAVDTDDQAPIADEADAFVAGDAVAILEALADLAVREETTAAEQGNESPCDDCSST
jgi:electron transfer flavoprotein alpha subunit